MNILKAYVLVNGKTEIREMVSIIQENNKFDLVPKLHQGEKITGYKNGMAVIKKFTKKELAENNE
jgi:hypothetical protein